MVFITQIDRHLKKGERAQQLKCDNENISLIENKKNSIILYNEAKLTYLPKIYEPWGKKKIKIIFALTIKYFK